LLVVFLCCQVLATLCPGAPIITVTKPAVIVCGVPYTISISVASVCPLPPPGGSITPTGNIGVSGPTGVKNFNATESSPGIATIEDQLTATSSYVFFVSYAGDYQNRQIYFGPRTDAVSSALAPLVFSYSGLQTISDSTSFINIGYQYLITADASINLASLHLLFQYTVNVNYSCGNQGNGNPHLDTYTTSQKSDFVNSVASTNTWFPAQANQSWQYSFTLPASACSTKIHIKNIQININLISNKDINIAVQTQFSISGEQTNNGNGNNGQPVTNLNLNSECVDPVTDDQCNQPFSGVQSTSLAAACNI